MKINEQILDLFVDLEKEQYDWKKDVIVNKSSKMLAQSIKKLRKQKKLSQEKLARLADISYNTIIKIETGKANNPTFETLSKLADAFSVSMDELTGRNNKKNKKL